MDEQLTLLVKNLPNNVRQYAAYEYVKNLLNSYVKINVLVMDLRSDALRDRHWKILQQKLRVHWPSINDLTLGMVWDADLSKNEQAVKEVILIAQGEMALEEFLKQVRETWTGTLTLLRSVHQSLTRRSTQPTSSIW